MGFQVLAYSDFEIAQTFSPVMVPETQFLTFPLYTVPAILPHLSRLGHIIEHLIGGSYKEGQRLNRKYKR